MPLTWTEQLHCPLGSWGVLATSRWCWCVLVLGHTLGQYTLQTAGTSNELSKACSLQSKIMSSRFVALSSSSHSSLSNLMCPLPPRSHNLGQQTPQAHPKPNLQRLKDLTVVEGQVGRNRPSHYIILPPTPRSKKTPTNHEAE